MKAGCGLLLAVGIVVGLFVLAVLGQVLQQKGREPMARGKKAGRKKRDFEIQLEGEIEVEESDDSLHDRAVLLLVDDGMDPQRAEELVEQARRDHPDYGVLEICDEARARE